MAAVLLAALILSPSAIAAAQSPAPPVQPASGATAGERAFPGFAGMPDSRSDASPVILHGLLTDTNGAPLRGAEVLLLAHPSLTSKRAIPQGGTFEPTPVARTVTGDDGRYTLRAAFNSVLRMRQGTDGLDLEYDVFHADRHLVAFEQVRFDEARGGWSRVTGRPSTAAVGPSTHAGNRSDVVFDLARFGAVSTEGVELPALDQRVARHHQGAYISGCTPYELKTTSRAPETVAVGLTENGVKSTPTYTSAASTTSGMGWAVGTNGSWTGVTWAQNGTKTRSSGFTAGFNVLTAPIGGTLHREYKVTWEHKRYERHCSNGAGGYNMQTYTEPTVATGSGGDYASRYGTFSCWSTETWNGPYVQTTTGTATSYGSAFEISTGPGVFKGSAQSGYSSAVKIRYDFNATSGKWCGNNNYPQSAGRVKAWK